MATAIGQEFWPADSREREWIATISGPDQDVLIRYYAVLLPGEDLTEFPETWQLTWSEWVETCTTVYGLTVEGVAVDTDAKDRAAWRKLRKMINGDAAYTEANVRDAFGAVRRILKKVSVELEDAS